MQHHKFKTDFMNNILNKNNDEKKQTVSTGDSNLKLVKFSKSRDVNQFLEKMFCQNLISQKNLPTRVSAKAATLTDNVFIRNTEKIAFLETLPPLHLTISHNF